MCHTPGHVLEVTQLPVITNGRLHLSVSRFRVLLEAVGPSLALWRGAEIAALREVELTPPVLDAGCGDGLVGSLALWLVDVGIDPRASALRLAAKLGTYERLIQANIEEADLPDECMASVVCNSVLEHANSLQAVLLAIYRVLKPGGIFALTCPTEQFSEWLALPVSRYARWRNKKLEHVNLMSTSEWADILEKTGFSLIGVRPLLRRELVFVWDLLELLQLIRVRQKPLFSRLWKKSPSLLLDAMALMASRLDLSSPEPGGGRLIVARKA